MPNRSLKNLVGMHPYGHDSSVAHLDFEKQQIFGISLERVTRVKHDSRFSGELLRKFHLPIKGSTFCLPLKELNRSRFLYFDFARDYQVVLSRIKSGKQGLIIGIFKALFTSPVSFSKAAAFYFFSNRMRGENNTDLFEMEFRRRLREKDITFKYFDHHLSHASSAYYFAPESFRNNSLIVTLDGQGDGFFSKIFTVAKNQLTEVAHSSADNSLNLFYSACTSALGFNANADEGKLEALASYSNSDRTSNEFYKLLQKVFRVNEKLEIELSVDTSFPFSDIRNHTSQIETWIRAEFKGVESRDLAFGMQAFYEDFVLAYLEKAKIKFGGANLCVAGGGFANVKLNKRIFESELFENLYIFPAMGDDGAALGALILGHLEAEDDINWLREIKMPFFGPEASELEIAEALISTSYPIRYQKISAELPTMLARDLYEGKLCALFQGKMEYGPRALGHRSILANPILPEIKNELNLKFKKREWFQPFCPSILEIEQERLFESTYQNRHMTCAFQLKQDFVDKLPGIAHVDGTARAEFLSPEDDPIFYRVIEEFKELSGFGVLLNTSFNIHGKTIVLTPEDALDDFMSCSIDVLYIGNYRVTRLEEA